MNEDTINKFFQETQQIFKFLETEFGCKLVSSGIENKDYYPDAMAFVRYAGRKVGIQISWFFQTAAMNIALVDLPKTNEFPSKMRFWGESRGGARAINLYTLADMYGKSSEFLLKSLRSTKMSDIKKRGKIIDENIRGVLENLAMILQKQAHDILAGDTSIFSEVQKHQEELIKKEYPY